MLFALPFTIIFLPIAWFYLVYIAAPVKTGTGDIRKEVITRELKSLGPFTPAEKRTLIVFITTGMLAIGFDHPMFLRHTAYPFI